MNNSDHAKTEPTPIAQSPSPADQGAGRRANANDGETGAQALNPSAGTDQSKGVATLCFSPSAESEKLYVDYMGELAKRELSGSENFDKSVLTLSSAGLGLSVTFLKDVVQLDRAVYLPALYFSWGMFILAIASTLISFLVSGKALDYQKGLAERYYRHGEEAAFSDQNNFDRWTRGLNFTSAAAFVMALILTPVFVVLNLEKNRMATNYIPASSLDVKRGATVPTMQKPATAPSSSPAPAPASSPPGTK